MRLINADVFEVVSFQGKSEEFTEGVQWILEQIDEQPTIKVEDLIKIMQRRLGEIEKDYMDSEFKYDGYKEAIDTIKNFFEIR